MDFSCKVLGRRPKRIGDEVEEAHVPIVISWSGQIAALITISFSRDHGGQAGFRVVDVVL